MPEEHPRRLAHHDGGVLVDAETMAAVDRLIRAGRVPTVFRRHLPATPARPATAKSTSSAKPVLKDCIHLGLALPNQSGPCGQRLRSCSEFGTCTLTACKKSEHACLDKSGRPACPSYEPAD